MAFVESTCAVAFGPAYSDGKNAVTGEDIIKQDQVWFGRPGVVKEVTAEQAKWLVAQKQAKRVKAPTDGESDSEESKSEEPDSEESKSEE